jgi:hypothetical protein
MVCSMLINCEISETSLSDNRSAWCEFGGKFKQRFQWFQIFYNETICILCQTMPRAENLAQEVRATTTVRSCAERGAHRMCSALLKPTMVRCSSDSSQPVERAGISMNRRPCSRTHALRVAGGYLDRDRPVQHGGTCERLALPSMPVNLGCHSERASLPSLWERGLPFAAASRFVGMHEHQKHRCWFRQKDVKRRKVGDLLAQRSSCHC